MQPFSTVWKITVNIVNSASWCWCVLPFFSGKHILVENLAVSGCFCQREFFADIALALWRRVKCVSRLSLAMPTPWENVPLRCTPRKDSGREYPALQTYVKLNTLLRSTSGSFSARFCCLLSLGAAGSGRRLPAALRLYSWRCLSHWRVRSVYLLTQNPLCPDPSQENARAEQLESGQTI